MRLQVSLQRHTLPAVNIVFATGTGPASHTVSKSATIFNLLEDLNDLVPLESSDTEWGLEDYVVEVAATADQESAYECLHYLPIASVLREDDEVVVRPLLSNDLRAWRRGGRLQITEDGTHLIDGVVFSRQWTRTGRPEFAIPPRKRRRLLEDEINSVKENLEPLAAPLSTLMAPGYDQEDEEDEDYVTDEELDEHAVTINGTFDDADEYDDDGQGDVDGDELQLLLKDAAELENAQNADGLLEVQLKARTNLGKRKRQPGDDADVQESQETVFEGFTSPARSRVLQDVSEKFNGLDDPHSKSDAHSFLDEIDVKESNKQKANQAEGDDNESSDDEDYAAKSSPSSPASPEPDNEVVPPKPLAKGEIKQKEQSHESYVEASGDESSTSEDSSSSSDRSSEESSSSSESESESDSDLSSEDESSDDEQIPNKPLSASDKQPPNLPKPTPPGQGSRKTHLNNKRVKQRKHLNALKAQGVLPQHATFADLAEYERSPKAGSSALNDDETDLEAARQKMLSQLLGETVHDGSSNVVAKSIEAQEGLGEAGSLAVPETQYVDRREDQPESVPLPELSPESKLRLLDLKEPDRARHWLRYYFEQSPGNSMSQDAIFVPYYRCFSEHGPLPGSEFLPCILKEFSRAIVEDPFDPYTNIKGIRARGTISEMGIGPAVPVAAGNTLRRHPTARRPSDAATQDLTQTKTNPSTARDEPATNTDEPSPKRAKLDVSASRRLIFGALGSRNPKTAAQEKAVRDKLSAPARNTAVKPQSQIGESPKQDQGTAVSTRQSWKKKLVITAVECEKDGVTYPPPPFPFVQHWHKTGKGRRQSSGLDRPSSSSSNASFPSNRGTPKVATPAPAAAASQESNVESRTVSFEKDDRDGMPIPSDYTALANLGKSQCTTGAIIAFKQLEVDMKTFMPQVSDYKVARVIQFDGKKAEIILATRFRMQPPALDGEDDDQDKMGSFIIREAGDADDGVRELAYSELIEAKLIELSGIQVPASTSGNSELQLGSDGKGPETQEDTAAVPESVLAPVTRPTPPALDSQMEIATPRHAEISVLIKDAGFDLELAQPKLDSDLAAHPEATDSAQDGQVTQQPENSLLPSQSGIVVANTSALLTENLSPSPFFPLDEEASENRDSAQDDTQLSSQIPPVSSFAMRLQTTVEYPEIQMSLGSDLPEQTVSRNSSSHQDAQRLSPPPGNDTTLVASEQREPIEPIIEGSTPQAQPDGESHADMDEDSELEEAPKTKNSVSSRLGLSLDGVDCSYELSDDDSESEDEVPSLRGLTSSQKRKIMTRASDAKRSSQTSKKVSPRPLKRMTARSSGRTKKTPDVKDDDSDSDVVNLPAIKISASQREAQVPRVSQIPKGSQVVDLTLSSDPVGPGNSDGEFELRSGKQRVTRNGTGSQSRADRRAATVGNRGGDLGIGQRKLLTKKKSRSFV